MPGASEAFRESIRAGQNAPRNSRRHLNMFPTLHDISEVRAYLDTLVQSGKAPATLVGRIRENVRSGLSLGTER